jgi:hypothetical protein
MGDVGSRWVAAFTGRVTLINGMSEQLLRLLVRASTCRSHTNKDSGTCSAQSHVARSVKK